MVENKCDYADKRTEHNGQDGYCKYKGQYCDGNGIYVFDDKCEKVNKKDVCKLGSIFGNYHIGLTDEQINKLKGIYNNYLEEAIEIVSSYVQSSGKKYKDFYAVLGKHNWVYKEIIKRINEKKKTQREFY